MHGASSVAVPGKDISTHLISPEMLKKDAVRVSLSLFLHASCCQSSAAQPDATPPLGAA